MLIKVDGLLDYSFTVPDDIWNKAVEEKKADELVLARLANDPNPNAKMDIVFYEVDDDSTT